MKKTFKHTIDILLDAIEIHKDEQSRVQEAVEKAFDLANGMCKIIIGDKSYTYSSERMCISCAESIPELEPRCFSFNSPIGACQDCHGIGFIHEWPWGEDDKDSWKERYPDFFADKYAKEITCTTCMGKRLNKYALAVEIGEQNIYDICNISIKELLLFFQQLKLEKSKQ